MVRVLCVRILLTKSELRDQCTVSLDVILLEILEQASSLTDHLQKSSSGVVILRILLQVLCKLSDSLGKNRDLNLR